MDLLNDNSSIEEKYLKLRSEWETKHIEYMMARDLFKQSQEKLLKETEKLLTLNNSSSSSNPQKKLSLDVKDNSESDSDSSAVSLTCKAVNEDSD